METRTVHDPFTGQDVQISERLVDRLRGEYAVGPHLPNGNPEFGWRQFQAPPIQHEAAERIEALEAIVRELVMDLENEIDGRYPGRLEQQLERRRYERDMDVCRRARAMLPEAQNTRE